MSSRSCLRSRLGVQFSLTRSFPNYSLCNHPQFCAHTGPRGSTWRYPEETIVSNLDPTRSLVISQAVLSFSLPLALIPLVIFTGRKDLMGALVNRAATRILIVLITAIIIALNVYLLYGIFASS